MRFIFLYFLFLTNSFAQNVNQVVAPKYEIGDNWSFQLTDLVKKTTNPNRAIILVDEILKDGISFNGTGYDGNPWKYKTDLNVNAEYIYKDDKLLDKEYSWPLYVGKKWDNNRKYSSGSIDFDSLQTCEVIGFEKIKVVAGEFDSFKILCKLTYTNSVGVSGSNESYRWYSSLAKRAVKIQNTWWIAEKLDTQIIRELASYETLSPNINKAMPPKFDVGDTWSYQFTDLWKNEIKPSLASETVMIITSNVILFEGINYDGKSFRIRTDFEMNPPHYVYKGENLLRKEFIWPLFIGKKWSNDLKRGSDSYNVNEREDCEVESFEKVKVPAGEFDAFKIYCKLTDTWSTGVYNIGKKYRWYSATTKRVVKTQTEWRQSGRLYSQSLNELKSYQVK